MDLFKEFMVNVSISLEKLSYLEIHQKCFFFDWWEATAVIFQKF